MIPPWREDAAQLDAEIVEADCRPLELRAKRNAITPFYHLPNETVERILLMIQRDKSGTIMDLPSDPYSGNCWDSFSVGWVRIMLSCRLVRDVAVRSRALWSAVDLNHKKREWIELCLQRAGSYSLRTNGTICHQDDASTCRFLALFPRANSVRVDIGSLKPHEDIAYSHERKIAITISLGNTMSTK